MIYSSDKHVLHIYEGLCRKTLPKPDWSHAAHFAAACAIMIDPARDAFADMPDIIREYNEATGVANTDTEGYHHTITVASLLAVQHHMSPSLHLYQNVNAILKSEYGRSDWLTAYWSQDLLFSKAARNHWVAPDRQSLPFITESHTALRG